MSADQNSPKPRNKGGRPPYQPTDKDRQMVEVLAGFAIPFDKIALVVGVSKPTLLAHFTGELERGAAKVEAQLVGNLLRLAQGSDGTALKAIMFALNCRFGWSAYVPRPETEPMGKKEQANVEALTAHEKDPEWSDVVH